ncbi:MULTISPECIES: hypothetical protein [unclassified Pseudoalteromonas]|uniref:hypothetical protein n=1 Tax=Pseudoalteromonas TaxID=53246 RepID=UPI00041E99BB|nr:MULTISPECIES: hypothetical protein [unclassified Pseudoalteromonas]MBH0031975.1 hypothetical protein [Pseudoalteromonas sp. SWYJZ98]
MLFDRVTSKKIKLNDVSKIQSGRYALVNADTKLGFEQRVLFEPLLPSEIETKYTSSISFFDTKELFTNDEIVKEQQQLTIIFDAIKQINDKYESLSLADFSHFLPPEISKDITPNELDKGIDEVFENGVLFQINSAPRMSMRYDTELLPTSRVKRYANNYQSHLVAHSECWQQRTVVGIIPKKLLAKVSEDEVVIYENIVYAKLIDHIFNYLSLYKMRLEEITGFIEKFGTLDGNGKDHRLVTQVSEDWGRAFVENDVGKLQEQTEASIDKVNANLRKLSQLKSEQLYRSIPRAVQLPIELKQTNILVHDKNYSRAASLWRKWLKNSNTERLTPQQILEKKQENFVLYKDYIELILKQVFMNLGWSLKKDSMGIKLKHANTFELYLQDTNQGEWVLLRNTNVVARVIAIPEPLIEEIKDNEIVQGTLIVCPEVNPLIESDRILAISPITILGKEHLAGMLQQQIIKTIVKEYLVDFPVKLPNSISKLYDGKYDCYLTDNELANAKKHANNELYSLIVSKRNISKYLKQCPVCSEASKPESVSQSSSDYFTANCRNKACKASWTFDKIKSEFILNNGSKANGRFSFLINFNS